MIENIIFYTICFFFSLIGVGAIWSKHNSYTLPFIFYILGSTLFVVFLHFNGFNINQLFDVRHLLGIIDFQNTQAGSRRVMPAILFIFTGVVAYLTIIICLLIQFKRRITRHSS
jgi:hypothetical protein